MPGEQQINRSRVDEWAFSAPQDCLPEQVDVAIVGGGIVGCSAAWFLARAGIRVALFEKGRIAAEQSGRNWGWIRQQGRSPIELPLMMNSLQLWLQLQGELGDVGWHQGGSLYLAETAAQATSLEEWVAVARAHALDTRMLAPRELAAVLQTDGRTWRGALYTASDARAEPSRAVPALARAAQRAGARIVSNCAVRGVEQAAGRVQGVVTEHGAVRASTVVCAAGAWTRLFCRSLDVTFPQLTVLGTVVRTAPAAPLLEGQAWSPAIAIRRRADGGYTAAHGGSFLHSLTPDTVRFTPKFFPAFRQSHGSLRVRLDGAFFEALATPHRWPLDALSPFERHRVLDPQPEAKMVDEIRAGLERCFPQLGAVPFVETWGGMIEASPDVLPVIAPVARVPGFFVASGFSGHGFGIGPGAGKLLADLVRGTAAARDVAAFRLERFFDGSPIRPGPAI